MATIDLGKIAVTPEGRWSAAKSYERLSLVVHEGLPYISLRDSIGKNPKSHSDDWMPLLTEELSKTYIDTELAKKANDTEVVHKTGDETIRGEKYFKDGFKADILVGQEITLLNEDQSIDNINILNSSTNDDFIMELMDDLVNQPVIVRGVKTPKGDSDATNKKYVDQFYKKPVNGIPETDLEHAVRVKLQQVPELAGSILVTYDDTEMAQHIRDFSELNSYALIVIKGGDGGTILPSLFNDGDWLYQYQGEWRMTNNHAFDGLDLRNTFADLLMAFDEHSASVASTDDIPDESGLVHKTGDETITGTKTFNEIKIGDRILTYRTIGGLPTEYETQEWREPTHEGLQNSSFAITKGVCRILPITGQKKCLVDIGGAWRIADYSQFDFSSYSSDDFFNYLQEHSSPIATLADISNKADKTYVDGQLQTKASASELTELSRKVDSLVVIDNEMV